MVITNASYWQMAECIPSTSQSTTASKAPPGVSQDAGGTSFLDAAAVADKATKSARRRPAMTDYADAIESLEEELASEGLRRRVPWDALSISSDMPGLHEVKV